MAGAATLVNRAWCLALSPATFTMASGRQQESLEAGRFRASPGALTASPCAGGRYIEVFREKNVPAAKVPPENSAKPWQGRTLGEHEEEEDLADSGRLFVRNLPYTSSEEDLEKLFSKYGRGVASGSPQAPAAGGPSPHVPPAALDLGLMTAPSGLSFLIHKMGLTIAELL